MVDSSCSQRREVYYSGRVQGVGFRYTTQSVARRFDVAGFVRNLPDGRVHLVAEGTAAELDRFLEEVGERMARAIQDVEIDVSSTPAELIGFSIRY